MPTTPRSPDTEFARTIIASGALRTSREAVHVSASDAAAAVGVSAQRWSNWENGRGVPTGEIAASVGAMLRGWLAVVAPHTHSMEVGSADMSAAS